MKENKMKTLKKVIIPVIILCSISCSDNRPWVTSDVSSTSDTSSNTSNPTDSSGESTGSSTTLVESSTTLTSTAETGTSGTRAICGNSVVEFPEECDEGEAGTGNAFCTYNCTISFCGDNIINALDNEKCDDGNTNKFDSCDLNCLPNKTCSLINLSSSDCFAVEVCIGQDGSDIGICAVTCVEDCVEGICTKWDKVSNPPLSEELGVCL
jgi:cysteine-rich repeat protein